MKQIFVIVAKAPLRGFAKTRLAQEVGEGPAQNLYQAFLEDFVSRLSFYRSHFDHIEFFITPWGQETRAYFEQLCHGLGPHCQVRPQDESLPFFPRLAHIFHDLEEIHPGPKAYHLTGSDIPHFPFHTIVGRSPSFALGPDKGGGYYYLGGQALGAWAFQLPAEQIDGEGRNVCSLTEKLAQARGVTLEKLDPIRDIDTKADLQALGRAPSFRQDCQRTTSLARGLGLF